MLRAFHVATCWVLLAQIWPFSNLSQQHPTCRNTSQHGGQTHATCWAQQCCDMLRWHVAIVWPGLKGVHLTVNLRNGLCLMAWCGKIRRSTGPDVSFMSMEVFFKAVACIWVLNEMLTCSSVELKPGGAWGHLISAFSHVVSTNVVLCSLLF